MSVESAGGPIPLLIDDPPPGGSIPADNFYSSTDLGPYEVYVESKDNNTPSAALHPMKLGKILQDNNNITGIVSINKKGRNRIAVRFNSGTCANKLVSLKIHPETLNIYIPRHLTTCQGVIRNVDTSFSIEDIMANIRSFKEVIGARRLNRRVKEDNEVKYEPTKTVVLTFKGCILPKNVSLYYVPLEVRTYILPVVRCMNCLRFGHNAKACKSQARCRDCGEAPHPNASCITKCIHCAKNHNALSPDCEELKRQQSIKQLMAYENITFYEAAKKIPRIQTNKPVSHINLQHTPQHFPTISRSEADLNAPSNYDYNRTAQKSYANVSRTSPSVGGKKKRTSSPGYDREEINKLLWFPNGNLSPSGSSTLTLTSPSSNTHTTAANTEIYTDNQLKQLIQLVKLLPNAEQVIQIIYSSIAQDGGSLNNNPNNDAELECEIDQDK